jgi:glutathione S-transferase
VRVATVLNEKGLDFEIVPVDLRTGAHKHPSQCGRVRLTVN